MKKLKAAFIFIAPNSDPEKDKAVIDTNAVQLHVIGVKDYEEACEISSRLVKRGINVIELCGGFGHLGVAKIVEAVKNKIPVGVVRFDIHPELENKSGDDLFR